VLTFLRSLPKYHAVHKALYDALKSQAPAAPPAKRSKPGTSKKAAATETSAGENDLSFGANGLDDKVQNCKKLREREKSLTKM